MFECLPVLCHALFDVRDPSYTSTHFDIVYNSLIYVLKKWLRERCLKQPNNAVIMTRIRFSDFSFCYMQCHLNLNKIKCISSVQDPLVLYPLRQVGIIESAVELLM